MMDGDFSTAGEGCPIDGLGFSIAGWEMFLWIGVLHYWMWNAPLRDRGGLLDGGAPLLYGVLHCWTGCSTDRHWGTRHCGVPLLDARVLHC